MTRSVLTHSKKKQLLQEAVILFNQQQFYEVHEVIEKIWLVETGDARLFYQGIIQIASAFYHVQKGRKKSAIKLFHTGLTKLAHYPDDYLHFHLGELKKDVSRWQKAWLQTEKASSYPPFPQLGYSI